MTNPRPTVPSMNGRAMGIASHAMTTNPSETIAPARVPQIAKATKGSGPLPIGVSRHQNSPP